MQKIIKSRKNLLAEALASIKTACTLLFYAVGYRQDLSFARKCLCVGVGILSVVCVALILAIIFLVTLPFLIYQGVKKLFTSQGVKKLFTSFVEYGQAGTHQTQVYLSKLQHATPNLCLPFFRAQQQRKPAAAPFQGDTGDKKDSPRP